MSEKHFNPRSKSKVLRAVQGANQSTARPVSSAVLSVEQQILREFPEVAGSLITFVRDWTLPVDPEQIVSMFQFNSHM